MKRAPLRRLILSLLAIPLLTLTSGCVFLAVRGVEMIDPPQKVMVAFGNYFNDRLSVSVWLGPATKRSRLMSAVGKEDSVDPTEDVEPQEVNAPVAGSTAATSSNDTDTTVRKRLLVSLRNTSDQDLRITVLAVKSSLGDLVPRPATLLLAPGQRSMIAPLMSTSEPKIELLDVSVSLRSGDKVETHTLRLLPRVKG